MCGRIWVTINCEFWGNGGEAVGEDIEIIYKKEGSCLYVII